MSTFSRALRSPATVSDDAIERHLTALGEQLAPDPLFRRRVRSDVVNRFVAAREGIGPNSRPVAARGGIGRVGRACLYACFALGVSVTSVLAASQEALPDGLLYPLKQRIEELRIAVVPSHLRDDLAGHALGERIGEMGRLIDAGRLDLAVAMSPDVNRDYERLVTLGGSLDVVGEARIERHLLVLEDLVADLPPQSRDAVQAIVDKPNGNGQGINRDTTPGDPRGAEPAAGGPSAPSVPPEPRPTAQSDKTARPDLTPAADPTPTHDSTPKPRPSPTPMPTPDRTPKPRPDLTPRSEPSPPVAANAPSSRPEAQSTP